MVALHRRHAGVNTGVAVNAIDALGYIVIGTQQAIINCIRVGLTGSLREMKVVKRRKILIARAVSSINAFLVGTFLVEEDQCR